jgi:hypothetical protein
MVVSLKSLSIRRATGVPPRSLSDLKNRSEKTAERGQFLTISPGNSRSIAQEKRQEMDRSAIFAADFL